MEHDTPGVPNARRPQREVRAEDVLAELRQAGITTLEAFARRYVEALQAARRDNPRAAALLSPPAETGPLPDLFADSPDTVQSHRTPRRPLVVDGTRYDASQIGQFERQALHMFVDQDNVDAEAITAFTSRGRLKQHLQEKGLLREASAGAGQPRAATSNDTGYCWEHINRGGARLTIPRMSDYWNFGLPDLTRVYRSCFLFWCSAPWNDVISSLSTEWYPITFFEHINYQGSSFTVGPNASVPNLVDWGWNDRISSLRLVL